MSGLNEDEEEFMMLKSEDYNDLEERVCSYEICPFVVDGQKS